MICSCCSKVILVCPGKHAPVLVKLDGQHHSLPNGGEVTEDEQFYKKGVAYSVL